MDFGTRHAPTRPRRGPQPAANPQYTPGDTKRCKHRIENYMNINYMNIRRGVSRILIVLWEAYALWVAWSSYKVEGHITKEWIAWALGLMIVPPLVVYLVVKIVEWVVAGFQAPEHPVQHRP